MIDKKTLASSLSALLVPPALLIGPSGCLVPPAFFLPTGRWFTGGHGGAMDGGRHRNQAAEKAAAAT
jgi:hypothetical protein